MAETDWVRPSFNGSKPTSDGLPLNAQSSHSPLKSKTYDAALALTANALNNTSAAAPREKFFEIRGVLLICFVTSVFIELLRGH